MTVPDTATAGRADIATATRVVVKVGSSVAQSSTWTRVEQRSTCRRKSCPRPLPRLAPGIRPGTSATTNWTSPASTTPRFGIKVVNG